MRVRIVTTASYPDGLAGTSRIRCYAKALLEQGDEVEVVSPRNVQPLPGRKWLFADEREGVRFRLISNREASRNRWGRYAWAYAAPVVLLLHTIATLRQSDVFFLYAGDTAATRFMMMLFLRAGGKKVILELNEYPYATEGSKITRLPGVRKVLTTFTLRAIFPLAHGAVVISKALEEVVAAYSPKAKSLRIPILAERLPLSLTGQGVQRENVYIFHAGSLSEQKDGILAVFEAFARAHHRLYDLYGIRLKFYLTNNITQPQTWQSIETILARHALQNDVVITGFCEEDELDRLVGSALALIINKPDHFQNRYNFPTKLGVYLASGRPVIFAGSGLEANHYLRHEVNAIVVPPDDSEQMAEAVVRCYCEPEFAEKIGKGGAETVEQHFYYRQYGSRLSEFLRSL